MNNPKLALVIPCYNESEIVEESATILVNTLNDLIEKDLVSKDSYICFVDDGSKDSTWEKLCNLSEKFNCLHIIKFACNFGHQKAIMAGMCENIADIYVTLDCDLQDDPSIISEMVQKFKTNDIDVVYGVRNSRRTDSFFKKITARAFYKFCSIMGIKTLYDAADYRLVSNKVVNVLRENKENNLYLRALIYLYGFKHEIIYYKRLKRIGGEPKYNFLSSLNLAVNGLTAFSVRPIRLIFLISLILFAFSIIKMSEILFVGALNLFCTYILGEYLFATLIESKKRPNYVISDKKNC